MVDYGVVDLAAHGFGLEAADGVGDDYAIEFRQAALFGFELEQIGEGAGADGDGRDAQFFKEDGGVDTPRRAGASIAGADQEEVRAVAQGGDR